MARLENIFDCHSSMEMLPASRDAAEHPTEHRIAPTTKSSQAPNVSGAKAGSPCTVHLLGVLSQQAREAGVIRSHFLSGALRPREGNGLPLDSQPNCRRPPRVEGIWKWRAFQTRRPFQGP